MKKIGILVIVLLLLVTLLVTAVQGATVMTEANAPPAVIPGTFFPLTLKITNSNPTPIENLAVDLTFPGSFNVDREDRTIPMLAPGQSIVLNWNVHVRATAVTRYETIGVRLTSATINQDVDIPILIKSIESTLEVEKVETSSLEPGQDGTITFHLRNHASYQLKDIRLALELSPTLPLPITPNEGTEESIVESLTAGEETVVSLSVKALPKSEAGRYVIPLRISYFDQFGQSYTKTNSLGLTISAVPELQITAEGKIIEDQSGELTLKIVNTGLTPIQSLAIQIQHPAIISSSSLYIGSLERDDFQTEQITILAHESFPLALTVQFRDAENKPYTKIVTVPIEVVDRMTAERLGLKSSFPWIYLAFPFVGVIFILVIRKMMKKKNQKP